MKKRFTDEQIIRVLKKSEAGAKTSGLCRRHGIREATFYNRKARLEARMCLRRSEQRNGHKERPRSKSQGIGNSPYPFCSQTPAAFCCQ